MDPIEDLRRHYHPFRLIRVKRACGADAQTFGKLCFRKFLSFLLVRKDSVSLARCRVSSFGSNETYHVSVDRLTRAGLAGDGQSRFSLVSILSIFASDPSVDCFSLLFAAASSFSSHAAKARRSVTIEINLPFPSVIVMATIIV
jgi:hypothetical protein